MSVFGLALATAIGFVPPASAEPPAHVSCSNRPYEIDVTVTGVTRSVGLVTAELYPDVRDVFLRGPGRIEIARYAAKAPETRFCLHAPGRGRYAVSVYHDENANTDFDRRIFGLPAEPWGLSNNPPVRLRKPDLEDSLFPVDGNGAKITIKLH
jgi:uncharacterized protein (DUF2141 family)